MNRQSLRFVPVVLCLFFVSAVWAQRTIQFTKVDRPPTLHGDLSDPVWKQARPQGSFYLLNKKEKAKAQTEIYPLYDNENLYLGVICHEPLMAKIRAEIVQHDGPVFGDDDIELFLSPTGRRMFQLVTNSLGTRLESTNEFYEYLVSDTTWSNPWSVRTAKGSDRWTAEIVIPFSSLELREGTPSEWVLNVGRERTTEPEISDIISVRGFFDWPNVSKGVKTSPLKVDFSRFYYDIQNLTLSSEYTMNNRIENRVKMLVSGKAGRSCDLQVCLSAWSGEKEVGQWSENITLAGVDKKEVSLPIMLDMPAMASLTWKVEIRQRSDQTILLSRNFNRIEQKPLLDVFEVQPVYNSKFYTGQERKVILGIVVNSPHRDLALDFRVDHNAKTLEARREKAGMDQYTFDFSRYDLGMYQIQIQLRNQEGRILTEVVRAIEILKPGPGSEVTISRNNCLLINNKPFFPVGFYHAPVQELKTLKGFGFNANFTYDRAIDLTSDGLDRLLKKEFAPLADLGMERIIDLEGTALKDLSRDHLLPAEVEVIERTVEAVKATPSLLGYYLHDEPEGHNVSPKILDAFSHVVKSADPYHPTIILGHTIGIKPFFVSDIYMPDAYIYCPEGGVGDLRVVKTDMGIAEQVVRQRRGKGMVMATLKSVDYEDEGGVGRAPTFIETRNSSYHAMMRGARGIFYYTYYGHSGVKAYPEIWEATKMVAREMRYLSPMILADVPMIELQSSNKDIELWAKKYQGSLYILALNTKSQKTTATITLLEAVDSLNVLSEGRAVKVDNKKFSDVFEEYAVHVYTSDPQMPNMETLSHVKAKIEENFQKKVRSGDIALAGLGTTIRSSTKIAWGAKLINIINGVTDDVQWLWDYVVKDKPQWIELTFPRLSEVRKVKVFNNSPTVPVTVLDYQIQVKQGDKWLTVVDKKDNTRSVIDETFSPVRTKAVRLIITRQASGDRFCVNEIEVY